MRFNSSAVLDCLLFLPNHSKKRELEEIAIGKIKMYCLFQVLIVKIF